MSHKRPVRDRAPLVQYRHHTYEQWLVCARGGDCPVCEPDLYAADVVRAAEEEGK